MPTPPNKKLKRNLFVLIVLGLGVYFFLPQFARIEHAFRLFATLKITYVALSIVAQILSYLGSGYLLRTVVKLAAKPISIVDGALLTAGANSIGTLGGSLLGTAGMTYVWLRRQGVNPAAAGLAGWLPIFLNNATLAVVSLAGLSVLLFLKKSSGLLVASLCFAIFILAGGAGLLPWCLAYREKLMPMAMGITAFIAKLRHKVQDRAATEAAVGRLLEGWDALLQGGWHGPVLGALLNSGFDMLTLAFLFLAGRPWREHCGSCRRLRRPTTIGKAYRHPGRHRGCGSHNDWPVRHSGRGTVNCGGRRPGVSSAFVLAADAGRHRARDLQ